MIQIDFERIRNLFLLLLAAVILFFCAVGCKTIPQSSSNDSTWSSYTKKDTVFVRLPDSSMAQYLIDCQQTSDGYKARIIQMMNQKHGNSLNVPNATISGNVLTTTAYLPGEKIYVPVYRFYRGESKSKVYVKITNQLTSFQSFRIWVGNIALILIILYAGVKVLKRYTGLKLPI
jgi:hypothetical protein